MAFDHQHKKTAVGSYNQGGNFYWRQDAIVVAIRTHASVHDLQQSPGEVWGNFGGDGGPTLEDERLEPTAITHF